MNTTTYILQYRYDCEGDDAWRQEEIFNCPTDAHFAFTKHVQEFPHIILRVLKVATVREESTIASFNPISTDEYSN